MNRNGQGPENKGPATGWGRGECSSDTSDKRAYPWNGRMGAGSGKGHGMGRRGGGCGRGRGCHTNENVQSELLTRMTALEESIKELRK